MPARLSGSKRETPRERNQVYKRMPTAKAVVLSHGNAASPKLLSESARQTTEISKAALVSKKSIRAEAGCLIVGVTRGPLHGLWGQDQRSDLRFVFLGGVDGPMHSLVHSLLRLDSCSSLLRLTGALVVFYAVLRKQKMPWPVFDEEQIERCLTALVPLADVLCSGLCSVLFLVIFGRFMLCAFCLHLRRKVRQFFKLVRRKCSDTIFNIRCFVTQSRPERPQLLLNKVDDILDSLNTVIVVEGFLTSIEIVSTPVMRSAEEQLHRLEMQNPTRRDEITRLLQRRSRDRDGCIRRFASEQLSARRL